MWDFFMGWPVMFIFLGLGAFYLRQRDRVLTLLMLGVVMLRLTDAAQPITWLERLLSILGSVAVGLGSSCNGEHGVQGGTRPPLTEPARMTRGQLSNCLGRHRRSGSEF